MSDHRESARPAAPNATDREVWCRLHPWAVLRELKPFVAALVYMVLSDRSFGFVEALYGPGGELDRFDVVVVVATLSYALLGYRRRAFMLTDTAFRTRSGVLLRLERTIPFETIQGVTLTTSALERFLGIATVVVSEPSGRGRVTLSPVSRQVGEELIAAMRSLGVSDELGEEPVDSVPPMAHRTPQTRRRHAAVVAFAAPGVVAMAVTAPAILLAWPRFSRPVLILSGLTLLVAVRRAVRARRFVTEYDGTSLRTRVGELTRIEQSAALAHVQWVEARRWVLHRLAGLEVIRFSTSEGEGGDEDVLAPAWPLGGWAPLATAVFPGLGIDETDLAPGAGASSRRFRIHAVGVAIGLGVLALRWERLTFVVAAWSVLGVWWYPAHRRRRVGLAHDTTHLIARTGVIVETVRVVPLARIEEAAVKQSPLQRLLGTATLEFSGVGAGTVVRVPDLEAGLAARYADHLVAARRGDRAIEPAAVVTASPLTWELPSDVVGVWRRSAVAAGVGLAVGLLLVRLVETIWFGWIPDVPIGVAVAAGALVPGAVWFAIPAYRRRWRCALTSTFAEIDHGLVVRRTERVRLRRVQMLDRSSDPFERRVGLTSLTLRTPGDLDSDLILPHLPPELLDEIESRLASVPRRGGDA